MNQSAENSRNYTTADIQQYLDGKMDAAAMHAFEKALMDDPFLADAMEGLQQTQAQFGANRFNDELQQLEKQLASRIDTEKTAPVIPVTKFRWWAVAAAAVVIIVAGLFIFNSDDTENKESAPIAVLDKKPDSIQLLDSSSVNATITVTDSVMKGAERAPINYGISENKDDDEAFLNRKKPLGISDKELKKFEIETVPAAAPSASVTKDLAKEKEAQAIPKSETNAVVPKQDSVSGNADYRSAEVGADKENKQAPVAFKKNNTLANGFSNSYKGLLISPDNKPIGNAELIINQKDKAITNANGFFNFNNKDTQVSVLVNSPGYKERHFVLKNNYAFNELQIEPTTTLNETVVINKNANRERTKGFINFPKVMVQDAEPEMGWIEFEKYIEANRKNIQHLDSKPGEVVLSFQVSKDGSLSSFKIEQSLTPAQDEEAIRLIKTGPSWHLLKGKKARAVVIIRF